MKKHLPAKENPVFLFWKILWSFCFSTGLFGLVVSFFSLNTGLTGLTPPMIYSLTAFAATVAVPLYTLPAFFAYRKRLKNAKRWLWLNLALGWTVVGYFVCVFKIRFAAS